MSGADNKMIAFNETETMVVATLSPAKLDADGARHVGDELVEYVQNHPRTRLLINFQNITYLSSAALSELLRVNEAAKANNAVVQLCGLSQEVHKVFEVTQLAKVFKVNPDEDVEKTIMRLNNESEWDVYRA